MFLVCFGDFVFWCFVILGLFYFGDFWCFLVFCALVLCLVFAWLFVALRLRLFCGRFVVESGFCVDF